MKMLGKILKVVLVLVVLAGVSLGGLYLYNEINAKTDEFKQADENLSGRIEKVKNDLKSVSSDLKDISERISALFDKVSALEEKSKQPQGVSEAKLQEVKAGLEAELAKLRAKLEDLEKQMAEQKSAVVMVTPDAAQPPAQPAPVK